MLTTISEYPYRDFVVSLLSVDAANISGQDIILNNYGSSRFALGVELDGPYKGSPVLGVNKFDFPAIKSINWTSAGLICGHNNQDWIALSAKDIRIKGSSEKMPVSTRLWISCPIEALDNFLITKPKQLLLKKAKEGKGNYPIFDKKEFDVLPLSIKDKWDR